MGFIIPIAAGICAGLTSSLFLHVLELITNLRTHQGFLILFLPLAGYIIATTYLKFGRESAPGMNKVIHEIQNPQQPLSQWMGPLILLSTWLTHLVGGSAGREGTAVQMGASLSDWVGQHFNINVKHRRELLILGASAGFGAAIGAPWAGTIFGLEFSKQKLLNPLLLAKAALASQLGYWITIGLRTPHTIYREVVNIEFSFLLLANCLALSLAFASAVILFISQVSLFEHIGQKLFKKPAYYAMTAGAVLSLCLLATGGQRYAGLGVETILESFTTQSSILDPFFKVFFTAMTIGTGFKGGEFTPLVFVGSTLGSALSAYLPVSTQFAASLGAVAVFGIGSHTPLACSIMAIEWFGLEIAPFALLTLFVGHFITYKFSLYKAQLQR